MKTIWAIIVVLFANTELCAGTYYHGKTIAGKYCSVDLKLEANNVTFSTEHDGFGFSIMRRDLETAFQRGQTVYTVQGGDGPYEAKLALEFDPDGTLRSALYTQTTYFFRKQILCSDLEEAVASPAVPDVSIEEIFE